MEQKLFVTKKMKTKLNLFMYKYHQKGKKD